MQGHEQPRRTKFQFFGQLLPLKKNVVTNVFSVIPPLVLYMLFLERIIHHIYFSTITILQRSIYHFIPQQAMRNPVPERNVMPLVMM